MHLSNRSSIVSFRVAAFRQALKNGSSVVDLNAVGENFTNLTIGQEAAWGLLSHSDGSVYATEPTGDTFEIAARLLKQYGGLVDRTGWCELRVAGGNSYHTDKAGVLVYYVLQRIVPTLQQLWATQQTWANVVDCV